MSRRLTLIFVFASVTAVLGWIAHELLFTTFMLYDDEGYVLITLRDFGRHGGLYAQIVTQYGPFFYLGYDLLHEVLGFEWTSTAGRLITLVNWVGTAGFCTLVMYRARAMWPLLLFGLVDVFTYLWIMIHEPMHPGSTVTLLVAGATWLGYEALRANRPVRFGVGCGLVGAALALIKINVGAFLIFAAVGWMALGYRGAQAGRARLALIGAGFILPLVLMRGLLQETWIQVFVALVGLSIAGVILAASPVARAHPPGFRSFLWFVAAGLAATAVVAGMMLLRGTSLAALWEGVIMAPLRHPGVYSFALRWRPGVLLVAAAALGLGWLAFRNPDDRRLQLAIAWIRITVTLLFQITLLPSVAVSQAALGMCYGVPLAGLFALPLVRAATPTASQLARAWLAVVLVFQCLHAYPVAASQLNWGTFLWVPLMLLGFQEAGEIVLADRPAAPRIRAGVAFGALALTAGVLYTLVSVARHNRINGEPVDVPGAERLVIPAQISSAFRVITENARLHASVMCSLPGTYSFNLWSGVPTPTLANATHWFTLLNPAQQRAMAARLEAEPRSAFLVQHNILAALIEDGFRAESPVLEYLRANYRRAFAIEGYSFWVRRERDIAVVNTGVLQAAPAGTDAPHRMELTLNAQPGEVHRIELWHVGTRPWRAMELDRTNTRIEVTPLGLDGNARGEPARANWPLPLPQVTRLSVEFYPLSSLPQIDQIEAVLLDAEGRRLARARILAPEALSPLSAAAPPAKD